MIPIRRINVRALFLPRYYIKLRTHSPFLMADNFLHNTKICCVFSIVFNFIKIYLYIVCIFTKVRKYETTLKNYRDKHKHISFLNYKVLSEEKGGKGSGVILEHREEKGRRGESFKGEGL